MISKPLLKQSIKANGVMWGIITAALCFMLACVMLIGGTSNLAKIRDSVQNNIIESVLTANTKKTSLNYYDATVRSLEKFDGFYLEESKKTEITDNQKYFNAAKKLSEYIESGLSNDLGITDKEEQEKIKMAVYLIVAPYEEGEITGEAICPWYADIFYLNLYFVIDGGSELMLIDGEGTSIPYYDVARQITKEKSEQITYRETFAFRYTSKVLAGLMTDENTQNAIVESLKDFGVTKESYKKYGFSSPLNVAQKSREAINAYQSNLTYLVGQIDPSLSPEQKAAKEVEIKNNLRKEFASSFLDKLEPQFANALKDIAKMDMYGILVGSIFFKVAGLLLPIIYIIMASNNLIAGQVDSGSMAYVLSTPTKRKTVLATQMLFLVGSLALMFVLSTATSVVCWAIIGKTLKYTTLNYGKILLMNLGAFTVLFTMSGISFLASSWCNRAKNAMSIGGGLNIFFLVATILGLFGTPVIPSIIRMEALNYFNYVSIISLVDTVSIVSGTLTFLWKLGILVAIGIVCYIIAFHKFKKKDLPL